MIFFGKRGNVVDTLKTFWHVCPGCQLNVPFNVHFIYSYIHLYFIFGLITSHQYVETCPNCLRRQVVPKEALPLEIRQNRYANIMHQFGLAALAGLIIVMVLINAVK
ncbi:hypothetical protein ACP8Y2_11955 [Herpetosiphon llansteffanensis]